jgi:hypothetical protein
MNSVFDYFLKKEIPTLILCTPNLVPVASLKGAYEIENTLRFNAISELTFKYPQSPDRGETIFPAYELLKNKMIVLVQGVGYYIITECPEESEGMTPIKEANCESMESALLHKRLTGLDVTSIMLYNASDQNDSLMDIILKYAPDWSLTYVDPDLLIDADGNEIRRAFQIDNSTLYNFLIDKVELAFSCVFTFDTFTKGISIYSIPNLDEDTNIFFSFNNVNKNITVTEYSDELTTGLYCYGADDLDIRSVNPLGTNIIYNFDYFKTTDWMAQDLIDAIDTWETAIAAYESTYLAYNILLTDYAVEQSALETTLAEYQAELAAAITALNAARAQRISTAALELEVRDLGVKVSVQNQLIAAKRAQVRIAENEIRKITAALYFTGQRNFDRFLIIVTNTYNKLFGLSKTWESTYNSNSTAPEIDFDQLADSTVDIRKNFTDVVSYADVLISLVQEADKDYWSVTEDDIINIQTAISNVIVNSQELYYVLSQLIPNTTVTTELLDVVSDLTCYNDIIEYADNFTETQNNNLQSFIYENTYTNDYIVITDIMNQTQVEEQINSLYLYSQSILSRASLPRYEVDGDFINLLSLQEYQTYITALDLGKLVTIEIRDGEIVKPALLEIEYVYDDPTSFNMIFSNRVRLNKSNFQFADLFIDSAETGSSVSGL